MIKRLFSEKWSGFEVTRNCVASGATTVLLRLLSSTLKRQKKGAVSKEEGL